jgi:SAM-dependent methyltransferase
MDKASMHWESAYQTGGQIWGEKPSELAVFACRYLIASGQGGNKVSILDIGCGYGRDSVFLSRNLGCSILGIDNAAEAIEMARKVPAGESTDVRFECLDFKQIAGKEFDVVFASNLYQILDIADRNCLRDKIRLCLKQKGKLFLSTLSTTDPEHFGKGTRVQGEDNSYIEDKFLHFCTREELERDFGFLEINELCEHEYDELRSNRVTHHHISWMLFGTRW